MLKLYSTQAGQTLLAPVIDEFKVGVSANHYGNLLGSDDNGLSRSLIRRAEEPLDHRPGLSRDLIPALLKAHHSEAHLMTNGTVKFFNSSKGFGFITPDGGGKDAFVHISAVERSGLQGLNEGDKVSYDMESARDGKESAVNLKLIK